jgi:hypothetical protein
MARSSLTYIPFFSVKFFFQFGLIWFWGFRGEDLNVKVYDGRQVMAKHYQWC